MTRSHGVVDAKRPCPLTEPLRIPKTLGLNGEPQSAALLKYLPPEMILQVFHHLAPVDGFMLSVSCKALLSISQLANLKVPSRLAHRAPWASSLAWFWKPEDPTTLRPPCRCGSLEALLRKFERKTGRGRKDRSRSICIDCMKWLPRRKSYWRTEALRLRNERWDEEVDDDWQHAAKYFTKGIKMQCPPCRLKEYGNSVTENEMGLGLLIRTV